MWIKIKEIILLLSLLQDVLYRYYSILIIKGYGDMVKLMQLPIYLIPILMI